MHGLSCRGRRGLVRFTEVTLRDPAAFVEDGLSMASFIKCRSCGSSNRIVDSHCYQCESDLRAQAEQPTVAKSELEQVAKLESSAAFYGKCVVFALALLICRPYFTQPSVYGVFEYAILPFHEAGHYFLMPFVPHTLMVAGGTIVQLGMPLGFALYFLLKRKEPFSACVPTLWLFGSMQQMAIYMKDARFLLLPMFGADPSEGHDWNYLFGKMHLLHKSVEIGELFHTLAKLGIGATLLVMAALLIREPGLPWKRDQSL